MLQWATLSRQRQEWIISSADAACGCIHQRHWEAAALQERIFISSILSAWDVPVSALFQTPKPMQHSKISTSQQFFFWYPVSAEAMCWGSPSLPEKGLGETSLNWTKSEPPNSMSVFCRILGTFYWFPLCATEHKFLHGSQTALLHYGVWSPLSTSIFWTDKSVFPIYGGVAGAGWVGREKMRKGICEDFVNPFLFHSHYRKESLKERIFCWIPL